MMKMIWLRRISAALLCLMLGLCGCALAETSGDWTYLLDEEGYAHVVAYGNARNAYVRIPQKIDGHYVVGVNAHAFAGAEAMETLTAPVTVTEFDEEAFAGRENITLRGYNGSAVLRYAGEHGMSSYNLSDLAFMPKVIDLTGITEASYSYVGRGIRLENAYARALEVGSLFFLPADSRDNLGDGYVVRGLRQDGDAVIVTMADADPALILEEISVHLKNLKPDYSKIQILDDRIADIDVEKGALDGSTAQMQIHFKPRLEGEDSLTIDMTVGLTVKKFDLDITMMPFRVNEYNCETKTFVRADLTAKGSGDIFGDPVDLFSVPVAAVAGVVRLTAVVRAQISLEGEVSLSVEMTGDTGLSYSPEKGWKLSDGSAGAEFDMQMAAQLEPAFETAMVVYVPVLKRVGEVFVRLMSPVKASLAFAAEFPETYACMDVSAKVKWQWGAWAGLNYFADRKGSEAIKVSYTSDEMTILDGLDYHMEGTQVLEECTKEICTVEFHSAYGTAPGKINVKRGEAIGALPEPTAEGREFLGWETEDGQPIGESYVPQSRYLSVRAKWSDAEAEEYTEIQAPVVEYDNPDRTYNGHSTSIFPAATFNTGYERVGVSFIILARDMSHVYNDILEDIQDTWVGIDETTPCAAVLGGYTTKVSSLSYGDQFVATDGSPYCPNLVSVTFPENMIHIGSFAHCPQLTSVTLPQKLRRLVPHAFYGCKSLAALQIPPTCTLIGEQALEGTAIANLDLPEGVETITKAFVNMRKLQSAAVPGSVKAMNSAFDGCVELQNVTLSDGLTTIGRYMFNDCHALSSVSIPSSVTEIQDNAFKNCYDLSSVSIAGSDVYIRNSAFANCSSLQNFSADVKAIGSGALAGTSSLESVTLTGETVALSNNLLANSGVRNVTVTADRVEFHSNVFGGCTQLDTVTVNAKEIALYSNAMGNCSVKNLILNGASIEIYDNAANLCDQLDRLVLGGNVSIGNWAFANTAISRLETGGTITRIGDGAFEGTLVRDVQMNLGGCILVGFKNCRLLESVKVTGSIDHIGNEAFSGCANLSSIEVPDTSTALNWHAFKDCLALESFTLPQSTTYCASDPFAGCTALSALTIHAGLDYASCQRMMASAPSLAIVYCPKDSPAANAASDTGLPSTADEHERLYTASFESWDGAEFEQMFTGEGRRLVLPTLSYSGSSTGMGWHYDEACTQAAGTEILMPAGDLTLYGGYKPTFFGTAAWIEASYPEGTPARRVRQLKWLNMSDPVVYIPSDYENLLKNSITPSQTLVQLPASVWYVQLGTFYQATALKEIRVAADNPVYTAKDGVLYSRSGELVACPRALALDTLTIPDGTVSIGEKAFAWGDGESELETIVIPESVTSVGEDAFAGVGEMTRVYGPLSGPVAEAAWAAGIAYNNYLIGYVVDDVLIGAASAAAGGLLPEVAAPEKEGYTFAGWSTGENGRPVDPAQYTMPQEDLLLYAVWDPVGETRMSLPRSLRVIGEEAFAGMTVQKVTCPDGLQEIAGRAFAGCAYLKQIVIPASVTKIAEDAFEDCPHLTILAPQGSEAHAFAQKHGIAWEAP